MTQRRMERKRKQRRKGKKARKRRFRTGFWGSLSFTGLISRLSHNSQIVWHLDYTVNSRWLRVSSRLSDPFCLLDVKTVMKNAGESRVKTMG